MNIPTEVYFWTADGKVNRARFSGYVNAFMSYLGTLGFVDAPRPPGFSVVPLAVYRASGRNA